MVYDPRNRYCPVHPTVVHPCSVCATPGLDSAVLPADTPIADVDWEAESATPYNTLAPQRDRTYNFQRKLAEHLGLDEHLDDPKERQQAPPQLPSEVPWKP